MKAKDKIVLLGIFLLFSSKSLKTYSIPITSENNKDISKTSGNAIQSYENQNKINNATITVSGTATGMVASREPSIVENRGTIAVNGGTAKGMQATGVGAKGINNGTINHTGDGTNASNAMLSQNGGYIENGKLGVINISGKDSSGMMIQGIKDGVNSQGINKGTINVSYGTPTEKMGQVNGIKVSANGIGKNEGIINLQTNNTAGFLVSGENAQGVNEKTGVINVMGNSSVGMKVSESSKKNPTAENKGIINVIAGAGTIGMQAFGIGTKAVNNGLIHHEGDGIRVSNAMFGQNGGYIENGKAGLIDISGKDSSGMMIQGVPKDGIISQGTNKGIINVSYGTPTEKMGQVNGIKVSANGIGKNEGIINLQTNNTVGFLVSGENALGENEKSGVINVLGNKSVGISISGKGVGTNNGNLYVTGEEFTSGMQAVGTDSKGINSGTIIHTGNGKTSNAMLAQTGGYIENNNLIQVSTSNASGMAADKSGSSLKNTGDILVLNKAKGIKLTSGASGITSGRIEVKEGTGISIETGSKGENQGDIYVTGNSSAGMSVAGSSEGINTGNIYVTGKQYTTGIKVDGAGSQGINNGTIIHEGDGQTSNAILAQNGGVAENNGLIQISKINTSAMSSTGVGSKVLNNTDGKITVFDKALGMKIEKGGYGENSGVISNNSTGIGMDIRTESSGKNSGLIENYSTGSGLKVAGVATNTGEIKNYGSGNAVFVSNGTFINDGGTIDGGTGIAIRSEVIRRLNPDDKKYYDVPTNNNVVLKDGKVNGDILGGVGIDALFFQGDNTLSNTRIENYEILSATGGNSKIENSFIDLEYSQGNKAYFDENTNKLQSEGILTTDKGKLEISNSTLVIDFKNSLTDKTLENAIISADKLILNGDINFSFISGDGRSEFNLSEAFGGVNIELGENGKINSSVVWDYEVKDGNVIAKKNSYGDIITTSKLSNFVTVLETDRVEKSALEAKTMDKSLLHAISDAEQLQTAGEFTRAMKQLSGSVYGYMADIASINSRTLSKRMMDRVNQSDFTRGRATNSSTQDVMYMDNNHRISGLMDVSYIEHGILGVTEKQVETNAKLGLMYGGSNGKIKFQGGEYGTADLNNIYVGGYYNYNFTDRFSLTSNARITNSFNSLKRTVDYGNTYANFNSTFPTYGFGLGTAAAYNILKEDYKVGVYGGIDWTKIIQGNISEDVRANELAVNNLLAVDEEHYDSVVPKAGILLEKTGYLFGRKYIFGGNFEYETELGNIKDGKNLKLQGVAKKYRVETTKMENMVSYNIFASLNLTEDFSLLGSYTSTKSKEYDSDSFTVGGKYKFNSVGDVVNTYFDNLAGSRSDRWRGTVSLLLEAEDDSDRIYFSNNKKHSGDYATSTVYAPKLTLSLNDLKSKWSYYFEGYYKDNEMFQGLKSNEAEQHATRVHLEARWNDTFSRGRYGINIAYRNETSEKPRDYERKTFREVKRGVHQIRLTPNFLYNLGNGFALNGSFTNIYEYNYMGDREGQGDFTMENQGGIDYNGLMPRMFMRLNVFREDTWHDHNNTAERKRLTQIRPTMRYYFGNGAYVQLEARLPIYNGGYSNETRTQLIKSESYETRYGIKYIQPLAPGLTGTIGATLLTTKGKNKTTGDETRYHSFRPMVGVGYNF